MQMTAKFNILATHQFNDITAFWLEEDGKVGFTIIPSGMEGEIASHRLDLSSSECIRRMCQARKCDCPAYQVSNAIQLKIAGDAYGGAFSPGETLFNSKSVDRLQDFKLLELPDGMKLVMTDDRGLELSQTYRCLPSDKFIRVKTVICNHSTEAFDLEYLPSFSLGMLSLFQLDDGSECYDIIRWLSNWSNEGRLEQRPVEEYGLEASWFGFGTRTLRFGEQGSMPVKGFFPQVGFLDHKAGVVWGCALDVMSSWELEVTRQSDFFTINGGYVDREFGQWMKKIEPGEIYETPEAVLTCAKGDAETLQNRLCSYSDDHVPASEEELPVLFNEWCTSWGHPYPHKILPIADRLAGHGIRYFVLDYGWFKYNNSLNIGDWEISHEYEPDGFRSFINHIREKGFIPGLWFEFENVTDDSAFFKTHPDLLLHLDDKLINSSGRCFLDFRKQECIDYLSEKVINFLKSFNIGYIKVDYNAPTGFGCDGAESKAEGLRLQTLAIKAFYDKIHAELPDLVMEICASGGHRLTHAWLRHAAMGSFSDAHEGVEIPIIAANTANLIPVRKNQIWAVLRSEDSDRRLHYSLAAGFLGRLCLSGDIANLTDAQLEIVDEAITLYYDAVPVLKDGENHLIRNLGLSYLKPSGWQAFVRTNKSQKLVVLHTFKNSPSQVSILIGKGWKLTGTFAHNATINIVEETLEISNLSDFSGIVCLFKYAGDV